MTLKELKRKVLILGFEESVYPEEAIASSASIALFELFSRLPVKKDIVLDFPSYREHVIENRFGAVKFAEGDTIYDLGVLNEDLNSFIGYPMGEGGMRVPEASLSGKTLTLPSDYSGKLLISYKRLPMPLPSSENEQIDLPREYEHLLMMLVASMVWADEKPQLAEYYKIIYERAIKHEEKLSCYALRGYEKYETNRWA